MPKPVYPQPTPGVQDIIIARVHQVWNDRAPWYQLLYWQIDQVVDFTVKNSTDRDLLKIDLQRITALVCFMTSAGIYHWSNARDHVEECLHDGTGKDSGALRDSLERTALIVKAMREGELQSSQATQKPSSGPTV